MRDDAADCWAALARIDEIFLEIVAKGIPPADVTLVSVRDPGPYLD